MAKGCPMKEDYELREGGGTGEDGLQVKFTRLVSAKGVRIPAISKRKTIQDKEITNTQKRD